MFIGSILGVRETDLTKDGGGLVGGLNLGLDGLEFVLILCKLRCLG